MSFADLTPEAYEAAERAARGIVRQYGRSLSLEYDEVYHEALLYLAERPDIVPREMAKGKYAMSNMRKLIYEALASQMKAEAKQRRRSIPHDEWSERMAANGW